MFYHRSFSEPALKGGIVSVEPTGVVALTDGTLVAPGEDVSTAPRSTENGGIIEIAAFVIAHSGLARLGHPWRLDPSEDVDPDDDVRHGHLELLVDDDDDRVVVSLDVDHELVVRRIRHGTVVARCRGVHPLDGQASLRAAVGSIARVFGEERRSAA